MKKNVMKKWVKALRSGEYSQGTGNLVDEQDNFCCLGVLCNLAPQSTGEWTTNSLKMWGFSGDMFNTGILPTTVMNWAGMRSYNGLIPSFPHTYSLSGLNDCGKTFAEIADIIEEEWESL